MIRILTIQGDLFLWLLDRPRTTVKLLAALALVLALGTAPTLAQSVEVIIDDTTAIYAQPEITNHRVARELVKRQTRLMMRFADASRKVERDVYVLSERGLRACREGHLRRSAIATRTALNRARQGVTLSPTRHPFTPTELQSRIAPALWAQLMAEGHLAAYFKAAGKMSLALRLLAGHERELGQRLRPSGGCGR